MITHKQLIELGFTKVTRKRWYKDCLHGTIEVENSKLLIPEKPVYWLDEIGLDFIRLRIMALSNPIQCYRISKSLSIYSFCMS